MTKFLKYWLPALVWAGLLFYFSSIPHLSAPDLGFDFQDKVEHFIVYGILGYLIARLIVGSGNGNLQNGHLFWGALIGIVYGISDELHQSFVPGRYAGVDDVIADALGVIMAQMIFGWQYKNKK
ncbi:MAG: VanZ family protein [candidate division KSB1 bacterium]|nr:VanZ family protein [candidate division KSB1 bacterium]